MHLKVKLPSDVRCAVCITYDVEMCQGYSPPGGVNHGRIAPFVVDYVVKLCETAEDYGVRLQFFQVANGLEVEEVVLHSREVLRRGHVIDGHTYSHADLCYSTISELDADIALSDRLFEKHLGYKSVVLRAPGGYSHGELKPENQRVILNNGYKWVSGETDHLLRERDHNDFAGAPSRNLPFRYATGLIEIPMQGWMDRGWFDGHKFIDPEAYEHWREQYGHRPVPAGWKCPWTERDALEEWIQVNLACLNYAYDHGLLWVLTMHPYSHYLHDPENRVLPTILNAASQKSEKVWLCTLRDIIRCIEEE